MLCNRSLLELLMCTCTESESAVPQVDMGWIRRILLPSPLSLKPTLVRIMETRVVKWARNWVICEPTFSVALQDPMRSVDERRKAISPAHRLSSAHPSASSHADSILSFGKPGVIRAGRSQRHICLFGMARVCVLVACLSCVTAPPLTPAEATVSLRDIHRDA